MKKSSEMPQTVQHKVAVPGEPDTSLANAYPRTTEFDLEAVQSKTRIGSWGDEGTHKVTKKGNSL